MNQSTDTENPLTRTVKAGTLAAAVTETNQDPEKEMNIVSRATSGGDYDDISLCFASVDKNAAVLLLAAFQELLDGDESVSYLSIYQPFGMNAHFLQTNDELENKFAGDASVELHREATFSFEIVEEPFSDDLIAELQPEWTVCLPTAHIWRDGDIIIHADFKHDSGSVTSAAIPLQTVAEFFGLKIPERTLKQPECRIFSVHYNTANKSEVKTAFIAAPDPEQAKYLAVIERIIQNHRFKRNTQDIAEIIIKAMAGETVRFNTVGEFTPADFAREFSSVSVREVKPEPYELIYASYA